ncbi:MAG: TetR/AcrR family transcriptional regulator [Acidimicrobiia bacterium]|nr:TetR/AcrR family transcriptional regulator [Acidimicrobiia bacterium]MDH5237228.1 TetR/AcrR family transcriptional regulator [Acidimicrobiia bacterium]
MLTREAIIGAARAQVETGGFETLSLRAVARQLGVTAPALYDHVGSKAELSSLVAAAGYEELVEAFHRVSNPAVVDRLRGRALAYVDFAVAHPELFRLMFQYRPAEVLIEVDNELPAATAAFEANLADVAEAVRQGVLADRDVLDLSMALWASVHGVATVAQMVPAGSHERLAGQVIDAMLTGLRPVDQARWAPTTSQRSVR